MGIPTEHEHKYNFVFPEVQTDREKQRSRVAMKMVELRHEMLKVGMGGPFHLALTSKDFDLVRHLCRPQDMYPSIKSGMMVVNMGGMVVTEINTDEYGELTGL